jgi:hypothetical protein
MSPDDWQQKIKEKKEESSYAELRLAPGENDAREKLANAIMKLRSKSDAG